MKKYFFILLFSFLFMSAFCQVGQEQLAIIPQPAMMERGTGVFILSKEILIETNSSQPEILNVATELSKELSLVTGYRVKIGRTSVKSNHSLKLLLLPALMNELGEEGYRLQVSATGIKISAATNAGLFYGNQTLFQLLPADIESNQYAKKASWRVPVVNITDYPRFKWRGLMLDVVRHFFTVDQVKQFIDEMVKYKFNLLHLHLSDDQGWRLQIKGYPLLTKVGAWREERIGDFGSFEPPAPGLPKTYGGFYTQEDIQELVQYAKQRFVDILPEIDVPGHSLAALAAYPALASAQGPFSVASGQSVLKWTGGGNFYGLVDNSLCPGKEEVYTFLDIVFSEVSKMFPFKYIHIGGDETAKNFWEKSDAIKALMLKENLKDLHDVQHYFIQRVEKIVNSKGKNIIGWDEIQDAKLGSDALIMAYRNTNEGARAAKNGRNVVMSPEPFYYLDYMQGDDAIEPHVYDKQYLKSCYEYDPVPEGVDQKKIKGGQGNLWTELVYNMRHLQYMVWPRAFAISECLWSPKEKKNWEDFQQRIEKHFIRYDVAGIKYAPSMYDPVFKPTLDANVQLLVEMTTDADNLHIHYSFDNSFPDNFYPYYTTTLKVPKDASVLKVITYRNGKPKGRMITISIQKLKDRLN
ncbi:MAG: beta-N-acetylhexosaminidase [Ginsengibacter sp.]